MELKIRELTVEDNRLLISLIRKLINEMKESWISTAVQVKDTNGKKSKDIEVSDIEKEEEKGAQIFHVIIEKVLESYTTDLTEWFSSLLGISTDEYLKLPFDTDLKIIDLIILDPNFKFFFQRLSDQFKLQKIFNNISTIVKERFDSLTG